MSPRSGATLEGASLTAKQVHAFCDRLETLLRARTCDAHTFMLLTDPQSIMAIGLNARVSVADCKTDWDIKSLKECYPLVASDTFTSTYEKWYVGAKDHPGRPG